MLPICLCQPTSLLLGKQMSALMCCLINSHTKHHVMASAWGSGLVLVAHFPGCKRPVRDNLTVPLDKTAGTAEVTALPPPQLCSVVGHLGSCIS